MLPAAKMRFHLLGLSLVELMVSIAISMTVLSGAVQVLVASKNNFIMGRELAALQENARFALQLLSEEIRMAGHTGCMSAPLHVANSVNADAWYLNGPWLQGFEDDAGPSSFPTEFRNQVAIHTDAIVVRRAENTGLRVAGEQVPAAASIALNKSHAFKPGQIMVIAASDCMQVGIFQMTGPTNAGNSANTMAHVQGVSTATPGNCFSQIAGNYTCAATAGKVAQAYPAGSSVMEMRSEAYYVGTSSSGGAVPALFRERLLLNANTGAIYTAAEELIQGVENMQILYGMQTLDQENGTAGDRRADLYVKGKSALVNWNNVVSVRLTLRMRSVLPVHGAAVDFGEFEGIDNTDGADRFMRQLVSTTIALRNP